MFYNTGIKIRGQGSLSAYW